MIRGKMGVQGPLHGECNGNSGGLQAAGFADGAADLQACAGGGEGEAAAAWTPHHAR